ncbi:IS66 family insertion sequence element accessory protein TnpA [Granulosicoccus sp. 3-233]|uniref:IS66 family insertion sequence element accessory protein TnpA n=1 Tax=Granulosicoccus sp. 3-233 TaxID=3417969 RepID=UPI003D32B818
MSLRTRQLPRKRSDKRQFWQHHVRQQARGKLTQRRYCERHGIGYASFVRWRRLLSGARQPSRIQNSSVSAFVPVQVATPNRPSVEALRQDADSIDLLLPGGMRIEGITAANIELVAALVSRL